MDESGKYRVIDGGLASELVFTHKIHLRGDPLWSARLLVTNTDAIKQVHSSFLEGGADFITTATYQASIPGFKEHLSVTTSDAVDLYKKSVDICKSARDDFWEKIENRHGRAKPLIVGSVGPYGAYLADGSEYSGSYVDKISVEELMEWHRPNVRALLDAGVDMLGFETIPAQKEAEAIVKLMKEFPAAKAWISFSCKDGQHTFHDDSIATATSAVLFSDQITAVGVNCTNPVYVTELLTNIPDRVKEKKSIVAYPNGGQDWMQSETDGWQARGTVGKGLHEYVDEWIRLGATWIGGCCCVTPEEIALIRKAMRNLLTCA